MYVAAMLICLHHPTASSRCRRRSIILAPAAQHSHKDNRGARKDAQCSCRGLHCRAARRACCTVGCSVLCGGWIVSACRAGEQQIREQARSLVRSIGRRGSGEWAAGARARPGSEREVSHPGSRRSTARVAACRPAAGAGHRPTRPRAAMLNAAMLNAARSSGHVYQHTASAGAS